MQPTIDDCLALVEAELGNAVLFAVPGGGSPVGRSRMDHANHAQSFALIRGELQRLREKSGEASAPKTKPEKKIPPPPPNASKPTKTNS